MYIETHIDMFTAHFFFNITALVFFSLVAVGILQAGKWDVKLISLFLFLSVSVFVVCINSDPHKVIGTGGGIALPMQAQDLITIGVGFFIGSIISLIYSWSRKNGGVN